MSESKLSRGTIIATPGRVEKGKEFESIVIPPTCSIHSGFLQQNEEIDPTLLCVFSYFKIEANNKKVRRFGWGIVVHTQDKKDHRRMTKIKGKEIRFLDFSTCKYIWDFLVFTGPPFPVTKEYCIQHGNRVGSKESLSCILDDDFYYELTGNLPDPDKSDTTRSQLPPVRSLTSSEARSASASEYIFRASARSESSYKNYICPNPESVPSYETLLAGLSKGNDDDDDDEEEGSPKPVALPDFISVDDSSDEDAEFGHGDSNNNNKRTKPVNGCFKDERAIFEEYIKKNPKEARKIAKAYMPPKKETKKRDKSSKKREDKRKRQRIDNGDANRGFVLGRELKRVFGQLTFSNVSQLESCQSSTLKSEVKKALEEGFDLVDILQALSYPEQGNSIHLLLLVAFELHLQDDSLVLKQVSADALIKEWLDLQKKSGVTKKPCNWFFVKYKEFITNWAAYHHPSVKGFNFFSNATAYGQRDLTTETSIFYFMSLLNNNNGKGNEPEIGKVSLIDLLSRN